MSNHIFNDETTTEVTGSGKVSEEVGKQEETSIDDYDGGYGWICVISQLLITASTWGVNGSFGVYLTHYLSTNAFPGTSEIAYAFIGGLSQSQITFIAPLVTYCTKKLGTKPTLCIGILLETSALVAASFAKRSWHLFLTQGLLFGWGCSFLYIGTIGIIPQWFTRRRGIANGIAAAGSGLGGLAYSLGSEAMISRMGVNWSFRITAICAFIVNVTCTVLIRDRNKQIQPEQHGFHIRLLKQPKLILITIWAVLSILGYTIVLFSLPDNAVRIGKGPHQGAILGALVNLGMAIGRPVVGYFSDRIGRINMLALATFLAGIWCLCLWTSGTNYPTLLAFSILGGTVIGTSWATLGPILADTFGTKLLPSVLSIVWTLVSFPSLCAEAIALTLRRSNSPVYLDVQVFAGCMFIGSAFVMVILRFWRF
ncbi:putative transporter MCH2 [Cladobotryum mycophilum]|uniref:Transporter MCH2 n=1 Tax=Cladobotryum mycophilum TaxID=491253 RepID=A0ABR0SRF3_9HYPO